jgi:hypothetical protein
VVEHFTLAAMAAHESALDSKSAFAASICFRGAASKGFGLAARIRSAGRAGGFASVHAAGRMRRASNRTP